MGGGMKCHGTQQQLDGRSNVDSLMRSALGAAISPAYLVARAGQSVQLNCSAFGFPVVSTSWTKDGRFLHSSNHETVDGHILQIRNFQREDQGTYQCTVRNAFESARASANVLHGEPPSFLEVFSGHELQPGEWVSLKCTASGHPLPQITWTLDGFPVDFLDSVRTGDYVTSENYVISFVNISSVRTLHGGQYTCLASSELDVASNSAFVKVHGEPFVRTMGNLSTTIGQNLAIKCPVGGWPIASIYWTKTQPVIEPFFLPNTVQMGQRLSITCTVIKGDPPIAILWTKDGVQLSDKESALLNLRVHHLADYSSTLLFQSIKPDHRGNYTCMANNSVGHDSHTAPMVIYVPPSWLSEPSEIGPTKGDTILVSCQASGFPQPKIAWKKAENTSSGSYKHIGSSFRIQVLENGTLYMQDVQKSDSGSYLCRASNGVGTDLSKVIRIAVHEPAHFKSKFRVETFRKGDSGRVSCESFGEQPMKIDWMKDNQPLVFDPGRSFFKDTLLSEGIISELHIKTIQRRDSALYTCKATNGYGKDETTVQLIVQEPPDTPGDLRLEQIASKSAKLHWSPPFAGNSRLTKYTLTLDELDNGSPSSSSSSSSSSSLSSSSSSSSAPVALKASAFHREIIYGNRKNISIPPTETSWLISDLYPMTNYSLRLASVNVLGTSELSNAITFTTDEEVPTEAPKHIKAHPVSSKTIKVLWKGPENRYAFGRIRGYYIGYKVSNSNQPPIYKTVQVDERHSFKPEVLLKGLTRSTKYDIVVQSYNGKGTGPSSETIQVETYHEDAPNQVSVKGVTIDHHSVKLFWKDRDENPILGYVVHFKGQSENWEETKLMGKQSMFLLDNLRCGTKYQVTVAAYNRVGQADPSPAISVSTAGNVPSAPSRELLIRTNATSAILSLKTWNDNGCPIMYFVIQYKEHLVPDWLLLSSNVIPEQNHVIISDLMSATYYDLSMTAHSEAGTSEAQYLFGTLTKNGGPISPESATANGSVWDAILYDTAIVAPIFCICLVILLIVVAIGYFQLDSRQKEQRPVQEIMTESHYQSDGDHERKCETLTKASSCFTEPSHKREAVIVCNPVHYATCRRVPKLIGPSPNYNGNLTLNPSLNQAKFHQHTSGSEHGYDVPMQSSHQVPYMLQMHGNGCLGNDGSKFPEME
ncbi:Down syndrome cell adhesion molecule [Halotydeus destructor]|nr:Down syndrome cell adhesion molecule [Halotydeus destructor]